jgi:predicted ATPase
VQRVIRTPDQRLRVFISSTLAELAPERDAARRAVASLRLAPVLFELGARPHPPRSLYRAYLEQSHVFVGIYWQHYGWVAPGERVSGLEDEYDLSGPRPKLVYIKEPAPEREERLQALLQRLKGDDQASYKRFSTAAELEELIESDLALLLTESFEMASGARDVERETKRGVAPILPVPAAPTPLVGRKRELDALEDLILREDVRLVTLTGPGGIGKTRLALALSERVRERFPDGVVFASLAGATDPASVINTLLHDCQVAEVAEAQPFGSLVAALSPRRMLLVADNFEQALEAAPEMAAILAAAPGVKLLITSRAVLRLRGEHEIPVPPLPLALDGSALEQALESEAVRLFVERARDVRPDFSLDEQNAPVLMAICRKLDGLPLAIELAAARIRVLTPEALLARLDKRFAVLTGGPRDLPDRQRTLRATVAWSYGLLAPENRLLFDRLAVFGGGFTLEAAEEICDLDGDVDVLEGLAELMDHSLLSHGGAEGDEAEPRFALLQTIQEYAVERLCERGELEELGERHALYYLHLAETADPRLSGPQQVACHRRLRREHDNLERALHWFKDHDRWEPLARLAASLGRHWAVHGEYTEGAEWLDRALVGAERLSDGSRARALYSAGLLGAVRRDPRAQEMLEKALASFRQAGDHHFQAATLNALGVLAAETRDYERATALYEESLRLFGALGDQGGLTDVLGNLAWIAIYLGQLSRAKELVEEALDLARGRSDLTRVVSLLLDLGWVSLFTGDLVAAASHFEQSVQPARHLDDKPAMADVLDGLGRVAAARGNHALALHLLAAADTWRRTLGAPRRGGLAGFEEVVEQERGWLGEMEFMRLWAEGERLAPYAALQEALEEDEADRRRLTA